MLAAPERSRSTETLAFSALARLSPEAQLVLSSAGEGTDEKLAALLARGVDWAKVLWLAEQERATGALWHRLNASAPEQVPSEIAEQMRSIAMVTDFRMLHLRQRLEETVATLAAAGIEVVLLKGAALAEMAYASFTERPMNDLDLLVAPGRADEARRLLLGRGWAGDVDDRLERMYERHHHLPPLADASGTGVRLELHTALFLEGHPFVLTADRVWAARRPIRVGRADTFAPDPGHALLHTCLHFGWSNLFRSGSWRTFRDVERLAALPELDWDRFVSLAEESRARTLCFWTFRLAGALGGVAVPGAVLARLRPRVSERLMRRLERHFAHHVLPSEWICPSVRLGWWMWELGVQPRQSGFGAGRPWTHEDRIRPPWQEELRGSEKMVRQLRNLDRWRRYLGFLISGA